MIRKLALSAGLLLATVSAFAQATLTINGVSDRSTYIDTASFSVVATAGKKKLVLFDGQQIAPGVTHTSSKVDYHKLFVVRTNTSTLAVTNRLVRFIIASSQRMDGSAQP